MNAQSPLNVYGLLKRIYPEPSAHIVLDGVGLTKATSVHYAEERAGRRPFRRWAKMAGGTEIEVEAGGCSEGFENLAPYVESAERRTDVGESRWRIFPFWGFVDAIVPVLVRDPAVTHCNDAVRGGPLL